MATKEETEKWFNLYKEVGVEKAGKQLNLSNSTLYYNFEKYGFGKWAKKPSKPTASKDLQPKYVDLEQPRSEQLVAVMVPSSRLARVLEVLR